MALSAAALLDELMGKDRDRAPHEKGNSLHWSDPDVRVHFQDYDWRLTSIDTNIEHAIFQVCKYHLCGFCPCELFVNTRSDLGKLDVLLIVNLEEPFYRKQNLASDMS